MLPTYDSEEADDLEIGGVFIGPGQRTLSTTETQRSQSKTQLCVLSVSVVVQFDH